MPTINQLVRKGRTKVQRKRRRLPFSGSPQRRGVCVRVYTSPPETQLRSSKSCKGPFDERL